MTHRPKVQIGFVSFTEVTRPDEHRAYNQWHLFDHLPEQLPITGIAWGQRWVLTPALRRHRTAAAPLDRIHYVTLYLMGEPIEETLVAFMSLGQRLRDLDRFHQHRVSHLSGPVRVRSRLAAGRVLVSGEAIPYRPNTGVYVCLAGAEAAPSADADDAALLHVPGVAGLWTFTGDPQVSPPALQPLRVTWCWLDGDPLEVAESIDRSSAADAHGAEPIFSAALAAVDPWGPWDWFDGELS